NADRIIVLDRGRLVEMGHHRDLIGAGGLYSRLMAAQHELEVDRAAGAIGLAPAADGLGPEEAGERAAVATATRPGPDGDKPAIDPAPIPMTELWRRLLRLVRPWWHEMMAVLILGMLHSISGIALGATGALLVGRVVTGEDIGPLIVILLSLVPVSAILQWLDVFLAHDLAYRLLAELRIALYRLLDPLAPAFLQRKRSGDLVSTATGDVELIELFYAHTISPFFQGVLVPGGVLIALALIAWPLALILIPFLVAVALTPLLAGKVMERLGGELRDQTGHVNAHMVDSVQGLRTIAAFTAGPGRLEEIAENGRRLGAIKRAFLRQQSLQGGIIEALIGLGGLAVLTVGANLVAAGQIPRVQLPLATVLALSAFGPVVNIVVVAKELMQTVAAARRYFAIEDEPVLIRDGAGGAPPPPATITGLPVAFEGVTFRYGPRERPALEDVSFEIGAGQTVALVGRSGAGKSTAAHLLLRFWDPQAGRITIAGRDLRDFPVDDLRRQVSLVAQDTYLFNTSLWENLRLGNPDASDDQVLEAARQANVDEFASALPDGYETVVGERGTQLSGGQ
ncbi:MAG TPA: ABC transporter transmembrane domain-containing protein, partial [Dehalococcoidia bacterium]|nr:ABC transporter transmembrane domain-containing protein [Dehalococcoidia bacterium]